MSESNLFEENMKEIVYLSDTFIKSFFSYKKVQKSQIKIAYNINEDSSYKRIFKFVPTFIKAAFKAYKVDSKVSNLAFKLNEMDRRTEDTKDIIINFKHLETKLKHDHIDSDIKNHFLANSEMIQAIVNHGEETWIAVPPIFSQLDEESGAILILIGSEFDLNKKEIVDSHQLYFAAEKYDKKMGTKYLKVLDSPSWYSN